MAYSLDYQLNHDIDIFLKIHQSVMIHIATAGAILPAELAGLDEVLINNKSIIYDIDLNMDITINPYLDELLKFQSIREKDLYLADFKMIASKGIVTFDKTIVEEFADPFYHVVAWPRGFNIHYFDIIPQIVTPDYISNQIELNISQNINDSRLSRKQFDKFELFRNI